MANDKKLPYVVCDAKVREKILALSLNLDTKVIPVWFDWEAHVIYPKKNIFTEGEMKHHGDVNLLINDGVSVVTELTPSQELYCEMY